MTPTNVAYLKVLIPFVRFLATGAYVPVIITKQFSFLFVQGKRVELGIAAVVAMDDDIDDKMTMMNKRWLLTYLAQEEMFRDDDLMRSNWFATTKYSTPTKYAGSAISSIVEEWESIRRATSCYLCTSSSPGSVSLRMVAVDSCACDVNPCDCNTV